MSTTWGNYFMALGNAESGFTLAETNTFDDSMIYDHTLSEEDWQSSDTYQKELNAHNAASQKYKPLAEEDIATAKYKNLISANFINWLKALNAECMFFQIFVPRTKSGFLPKKYLPLYEREYSL